MASFTDNIPTFAPYRPEFPVEAGLMVGVEKERQFLEGVQRVQGYVSSLHGFDIMKPETRSYLEGKIGEMKTAVGSVNGDFSDQRLTNAIGGVAGKISNDPIVQNGITSTMTFRKGQADIEESKKNGKYSVENEWDFQTEASKWLNDKDYTTQFEHEYTPYIDVRKKVMDVIKSLGDNELIQQVPFVTDSKGNIMIDKATGKPIINHAIIEKHYKGKSADRIVNAITASLDSNDFNQLAITGRYVQKDSHPIEIQKDLENDYKDRKIAIVNAIAELSVEKMINTNDPQYQKEVEEKIDGYNNELSKLDVDYKSDLNTLATNPDAIKSNLYIKSFLNGISSAFTTEEQYTKYLDNPFFNNFMEEERFKLDKWYKQESLDIQRMQEERLRFEALTKEGGGKKGTKGESDLSYSPTSYPVGTNIPSPTELSFRDETNTLTDKKYEILESIVDAHAHKEFEDWKKVSQAMEAEGQKPLNKKAFLESTFKKLKTAWDSKQDLPQSVEEKISQLKDIDYDVETKQQSLRKIKDKADQQYPGFDYGSISNKIESKSYTFPDGETINMSGDDFVNLAIAKSENLIFKSGEGKERYNDAKNRLVSKFGERTARILIDIAYPRKSKELSESYKIAEEAVSNTNYIDRRNLISSELIKSGLAGNPQGYSIKMEKGEDKNRVTSFLTDYANETKRTGTNTHPDFDRDDLFAAISSSKGYSTKIIRNPSTSKYGEDKFEVEVTNDNSGKITRLYVTPEQAEQLTGRDFTAKFSKITDRLRYSATGTTNYESSSLTGKYASSAFLSRDDFPNVQLPVKADISKSAEDGKYFITLYTQGEGKEWMSKEVRAPNGSIPGKPSGLTIEQVESFLLNLNDTYLTRLFTK